MEYRRFGRTGLKMPVLTAGGMRFQASWKAEETDKVTEEGQANVLACLRRALALGINHIETARGYGTSEYQVGLALKHLPREQILLQTKIGPAETGEKFLADFEDSMARLGVESVDLLSIHGINTPEKLDRSVRPGGCVDVLERLRDRGRVRHIGFSTHGPTEIILRAIETGRFEYVNLHYFWIDQTRRPAVEAAAARDMGVFIISPTDKGGMLQKPSEKLRRLCEPLSPIAFNDLFCLLHGEVHTLSIGARTPADYDEHARAVERLADPQTPELVRRIADRLEEECRNVLGDEWYETWDRNLPDWPDTPGGVNVPFILRLFNAARALDLVEFARGRYRLLGNAQDWVPGNPLGQTDPADLAEALARSPHAAKIPALLAEAHALLGGEDGKRLQADQ